MKKMILLVATLLIAAGGYAESKDSLKVENVMSIDNPDRVTITESGRKTILISVMSVRWKYPLRMFRLQRNVTVTGISISRSESIQKNRNANVTHL